MIKEPLITYYFLGAIVVCLIIGFPTFFTGCNLEVSSFCVNYHLYDGMIYQSKIYKRTCSRCVAHNKKGGCSATQVYTCWDAWVYATRNFNYKRAPTDNSTSLTFISGKVEQQLDNHEENLRGSTAMIAQQQAEKSGSIALLDTTNNNQLTDTCKLQTANGVDTENQAEYSVSSYPFGTLVNWYKTRGSHVCSTGSDVTSLWYCGIVFLCLSGFILLIFCVYKYLSRQREIEYKVTPSS